MSQPRLPNKFDLGLLLNNGLFLDLEFTVVLCWVVDSVTMDELLSDDEVSDFLSSGLSDVAVTDEVSVFLSSGLSDVAVTATLLGSSFLFDDGIVAGCPLLDTPRVTAGCLDRENDGRPLNEFNLAAFIELLLLFGELFTDDGALVELLVNREIGAWVVDDTELESLDLLGANPLERLLVALLPNFLLAAVVVEEPATVFDETVVTDTELDSSFGLFGSSFKLLRFLLEKKPLLGGNDARVTAGPEETEADADVVERTLGLAVVVVLDGVSLERDLEDDKLLLLFVLLPRVFAGTLEETEFDDDWLDERTAGATEFPPNLLLPPKFGFLSSILSATGLVLVAGAWVVVVVVVVVVVLVVGDDTSFP